MAPHEGDSYRAVYTGSGNVFADLGFPKPECERITARLTLQIRRLIKGRGLTQTKAAAILGITATFPV